jgi:prevent-host-death family protein
MDISVTEFKQRCLELIRLVEATGTSVTITRRGKAVARLETPPAPDPTGVKPWERLRGKARWLAEPGERFISEEDVRGLQEEVLSGIQDVRDGRVTTARQVLARYGVQRKRR